MPIAPPSVTYNCPSCGWNQITTPRSDALMPGDFYDACPKCGETSLEKAPTDMATVALIGVARKIKGLLS